MGGKGSGDWGHTGRPGLQGGSGEGRSFAAGGGLGKVIPSSHPGSAMGLTIRQYNKVQSGLKRDASNDRARVARGLPSRFPEWPGSMHKVT